MNVRLWKMASWLGSHGWFVNSGLRGFYPSWWPEGYVAYRDLGCTHTMSVGTAHDYARMFKGKVWQPGTGPRDDSTWEQRPPRTHDLNCHYFNTGHGTCSCPNTTAAP